MESRVLNAQIFTSSEIAAVLRGMRKILSPALSNQLRHHEAALVESIRFQAIRSWCIIARESRGLTIKEAAAAMRVPQYRLKAIESGSMREVQGDVVRRYLAFLDLEEDRIRECARANRRLARKLGLSESHRRADGKKPNNLSKKPLQPTDAAQRTKKARKRSVRGDRS